MVIVTGKLTVKLLDLTELSLTSVYLETSLLLMHLEVLYCPVGADGVLISAITDCSMVITSTHLIEGAMEF